jgi:putative transposase
MTEYRHGSHSKFLMHFHIVWVTKYRKKILIGDVALRLREMIRRICAKESVQIIRGEVTSDHVHLFVSTLPKTSISKLV